LFYFTDDDIKITKISVKNTNINVKKSVIVDFDSFVIKTAWVFRVSSQRSMGVRYMEV
jgi:hypothetical protein